MKRNAFLITALVLNIVLAVFAHWQFQEIQKRDALIERHKIENGELVFNLVKLAPSGSVITLANSFSIAGGNKKMPYRRDIGLRIAQKDGTFTDILKIAK